MPEGRSAASTGRLAQGPEGRRGVVAVILAAGQGVRMKSDKAKVLHELCGRPMLAYVLDAMRAAGASEQVIVVGYGADEVKAAFADYPAPLRWVLQTERKGTGHAVMTAESALAAYDGDVVVACGDSPLLTGETVSRVIATHRAEGAACTVVTADVANPTGYGRIVRAADGSVERIVEEKDASDDEKKIREINSGNYVFDARSLFASLKQIRPDNAQKEYLLTDVVGVLRRAGKRVMSHRAADPADVLGVNSREQLADAERIYQRRVQPKRTGGT